ncbi:MAG: DUF362 domain-containing protein, partial [Spirochaetaceae bacterium]|nr:DUF362 domain-containing protein [Spirochaetaceae bacterium]
DELILVHGSDPVAMARSALDAARIKELIPAGALIAIKPNLVVSKNASSGATTHPELAEAVISYLREKGFSRFAIMEGSWVGDATPRAFAAAGYTELSRRAGVPLVDLQRDGWKRYDAGDGWKIAVCDRAMAADFIINMPVIKGHCQTTVTCALKNLKGCMPDDEKSRFHAQGLHEPIARLNTILRPGFILCDGICGDLDFEEGGNPVRMESLVAGRDPVLVDAFVCRLLGHKVEDLPYILRAEALGVGSADLARATITELGDVRSAPAVPPASDKAKKLARRIDERSACSACYASLIHGLARIEERGGLKRLDAFLARSGEARIAIGQDFKGNTWEGLGCGACTR